MKKLKFVIIFFTILLNIQVIKSAEMDVDQSDSAPILTMSQASNARSRVNAARPARDYNVENEIAALLALKASPIKKIFCKICKKKGMEKSFSTQEIYQMHLLIHHKKTDLSAISSDESEEVKPVKKESSKILSCECGWKGKNNLSRHKKNHNPNNGSYICILCKPSCYFPGQGQLSNHMKHHNKDGSYTEE